MSIHKSQLQEVAHKCGWTNPVYEVVKEGPSHSPVFQATVTVDGATFESPSGFPTVKAAEHGAAKVALEAIGKGNAAAGTPIHYTGLCKNLLQEIAQQSRYALPKYTCERQGVAHCPQFTATVEVNDLFYTGGAAKTRKEAETKAARVALISLRPSIVQELDKEVVKEANNVKKEANNAKKEDDDCDTGTKRSNAGAAEVKTKRPKMNRSSLKVVEA